MVMSVGNRGVDRDQLHLRAAFLDETYPLLGIQSQMIVRRTPETTAFVVGSEALTNRVMTGRKAVGRLRGINSLANQALTIFH